MNKKTFLKIKGLIYHLSQQRYDRENFLFLTGSVVMSGRKNTEGKVNLGYLK